MNKLNETMITYFGFDPGLPLKPGKNPWPWKSPKPVVRVGGDMNKAFSYEQPFETYEQQRERIGVSPIVVIIPGQFVNGHQFNDSGVYTVRDYPSEFIIVQDHNLKNAKRLFVTREFEIVVDIP